MIEKYIATNKIENERAAITQKENQATWRSEESRIIFQGRQHSTLSYATGGPGNTSFKN